MKTPADSKSETLERLMVLRELIRKGDASTQDELCDALLKKDFEVTQSTVSRDLRRIGAVKTTNAEGEIIYRLPEDNKALPPRVISHSLDGLVTEIQYNESMVVLHTTPGSASLVARHLDSLRKDLHVLGTLAGDDTIFVIPETVKKVSKVASRIRDEFF